MRNDRIGPQEACWRFCTHVICLKLFKLEMKVEPQPRHFMCYGSLSSVADICIHTIHFCLNNIHICILFYFCKLFGIISSLWKPVWISSDLDIQWHAIDYQFKHIFFKVLLLILSHCHSSLCWLWSDFFPWWIAKSPLPFEEQSNRKHLKLSVQPPWREWPFGCVVDF